MEYNGKKSIPSELLQRGQKWYFTVRPRDGEEFGPMKESNELEIPNIETAQFTYPIRTDVFQNYPNPFNPDTWIPYQLGEDANVVINIYNSSGKHIRTLNLGYKPSGSYINKAKAAHWDGLDKDGEPIASGVYLYTIKIGEFIATRKMIITR